MTRAGLTLIEVLIALIVIAVAFMALASVQISNLSVTRGSEQLAVASRFANDTLEKQTREVSKNIEAYYLCPDTAAVECSYPVTDDHYPAYTAMVTLTGLYQKPSIGETRTPEQYRDEGLVEADISVTGPAEVSFTAYISCYDVAQTTQLETGDFCPIPYEQP
ncbi:hypothetical protein BH24DEI2_BH24DEI2_24030 [soil metagenome]